MQPKPVFPRQLGPEAQQPTSRPLFRPAFKPRLGRFRPVRRRLPGAVDRLLSASDGHPRSSHEQSHLRSVPPVTLDPFPFLPASLARTKVAAGGLAHGRRPWPAMAGDGRRRWRAAPPGTWPQHAPPFHLFFLPLPLFPSPAPWEIQREPAMAAREVVMAPPQALSLACASTRWWARHRRVARCWRPLSRVQGEVARMRVLPRARLNFSGGVEATAGSDCCSEVSHQR
jgi:hypothetical protein